MEAFINVIRKDPKVRIKIKDMLDRYNRLPPKNQSKIRYDFLFQKIILKELIKVMGTTITDLDIDLKLKVSRRKNLESKANSKLFERVC